MALDGLDSLTSLFAEAVLNGLWQGLMLTALVWTALRLAPRTSAATRYGIWSATLAVVLALPLARLVKAPLEGAGAFAKPSTAAFPVHLAASLPMVLFGGWAILAAVMLGRFAWSYGYVRWLARTATPLAGEWQDRMVRLTGASGLRMYGSRETAVPIVIGLLKPAILMPFSLLDRLNSEELDQIVLHEWAHVRRLDNWTNCALELVKAAYFFHPAVWWIARHMQLEREIACDDAVVQATGEAAPYAGCLLKLVELSSCPGVSLSPGVGGDGGDLFRRVERLIHWHGGSGFSVWRFAGAVGVLLAAAVLAKQMPALVDIPAPTLALRAPHADMNATQQIVLAEVRMRTANIFMKTAEERMASADRLMRAAREQMRLAQIAAGNGRLPVSRVSCEQSGARPAGSAAELLLNKI